MGTESQFSKRRGVLEMDGGVGVGVQSCECT